MANIKVFGEEVPDLERPTPTQQGMNAGAKIANTAAQAAADEGKAWVDSFLEMLYGSSKKKADPNNQKSNTPINPAAATPTEVSADQNDPAATANSQANSQQQQNSQLGQFPGIQTPEEQENLAKTQRELRELQRQHDTTYFKEQKGGVNPEVDVQIKKIEDVEKKEEEEKKAAEEEAKKQKKVEKKQEDEVREKENADLLRKKTQAERKMGSG